MRLHEGLNEQQLDAVNTIDGPLLILAGAGSGKTRTIIHRTANIILSGAAMPYQILALTFTNKAASEMKERIEQFNISNLSDMWMGTFHSICARILRMHAEAIGYTRYFSIYDEDDSKSVISAVLKEMGTANKKITPGHLKSVISKAKEKMLTPEEFDTEFSGYFDILDIGRVYRLYQKRLKDSNAMDFDDLLLNTVLLFESSDEILSYYQNRFKYILVDEYQDTNMIQYRIVSMIAAKHKNVCVCGDDDQCIYSWRGADLRNILEFELNFPQAKVIRLEENYRSTKNILDAANALIENNQARKGKKLFTQRSGGDKLSLFAAYNESEEAEHIASEIEKLRRAEVSLSDTAILYRVNSQSRMLEESLLRRRIAYQIIGGIRFYDRMEVKDILAYLRLAVNPDDSVSFARAVSVPRRGVGAASIDKLREYTEFKGYDLISSCRNASEIPSLSASAKASLVSFALLTDEISSAQSLPDAVKTAINGSGYLKMLKEDTSDKAQSRTDNLNELMNAAADFERTSEDSSLAAFLENAALISSIDLSQNEGGLVKLMTVHNAKGLEFDYVFISGLEDGLFPITRSDRSDEDLEEERRLCYVALTRAKKKLYLSYSKMRRTYNSYDYRLPSRFLTEIPDELFIKEGDASEKKRESSYESFPSYRQKAKTTFSFEPEKKRKAENEYAEGDKISHPDWGDGLVVSVKNSDGDQIITAAFAGLGIKKFVSGYGESKL